MLKRRPPRIMLAVHNGFSVRYLLQTDILAQLRGRGADVVILMQGDPSTVSYLADEGVTVDSVPNAIGNAASAASPLQRALRFVRFYSFGGWVQTLEDHYQIAVKEAKMAGGGIRLAVNMKLMHVAIIACRKSSWLRKLLLGFESRVYRSGAYAEVLSRHQPDLLVTTSLGTFDYDFFLLRAARRQGIATATVVLSWDNTTTRGYPGSWVDHVITWTEVMKREAAEHCDIPESICAVGGIAHFDVYFREQNESDVTAFRAADKRDPNKRTVLFITKSPNGYAYNPNIARMLGAAIKDGRLPSDVQILVRVHPIHYRYRDGELVYRAAIDAFHRVAAEYPAVVINEPEIRSTRNSSDMGAREIQVLRYLLETADVVVNIFSTINIEAAIFDRPLVNVCFEDVAPMYEGVMTPRFDIGIDIRSNHNRRVAATGGVRMVYNEAEMISAIADYLAEPHRDQDGRRRIVEQEVGPNRGSAGKAIGDLLFGWADRMVASAE